MKIRHYFILACSIVLLLISSCSVFDYVDEQVQEIQEQQEEMSEDAWRQYFEGKLTEEERDEMIREADRRAREAVEELPEEVKRRVELSKDDLQQRGSRFILTLVDILLGGGVLLGGGAVLGRTALRRKEDTTVIVQSEDPPA